MKANNLAARFPNRRLENEADMIRWAEDINSGIAHDIQVKCDYQDIWAHSGYNELEKMFIASEDKRSLIVCSMLNVLHYDEVERMLKALYKQKANKIINDTIDDWNKEYDKRSRELSDKEARFNDAKKTYWKRITDMKRKINNLTFDKERMQTDLNHCYEKNNRLLCEMAELRAKAAKYDTIKAAIA
jgi:chromosome segregation ATPase